MVANTKFDELDLTDDRSQELHAEIRYLRSELQAVTDELAAIKAMADGVAGTNNGGRSGDGITVEPSPKAGAIDRNIYVFEEEDEAGMAFDEFFAAPDPHLEKVRGFLLD